MSGPILERTAAAPRSFVRAQFDALNFAGPNNGAVSLRVLAELVRTEQVVLDVSRVHGELIIGVKENGR